MADKTKDTAAAAAQEAVPVEGLSVKGGKVIATPTEPEAAPPEAQPTPEKPAEAPNADEKVVANTGVLRVETALEKRVADATETTEANLLRDAKTAHADAAKLAVVVSVGTEFSVADLQANTDQIVRVRLLYDWNDGQGVPHPRGQALDLPYNEAAKLVLEGRAERADPPPVPAVEQAVADAKIKVLQGAA